MRRGLWIGALVGALGGAVGATPPVQPAAVAKPVVAKPVVAKPVVAKPVVAKLVVAKPAVVKPAVAPTPRWETLPLPPALPAPVTTGRVAVGKAQIYFATHGAQDAPGGPVVLLHGGMGSGEQFGAQLPALLPRHHVIVIDSRGHGRSTLGTGALGYHKMAGDVVAVLDQLGVGAAAVVGWSDGGVVALDLAITAPTRVTRFAVIGTNHDASGNRRRPARTPATFRAYGRACRAQHAALGGTPRAYDAMLAAMRPVWRSPGGYTPAQLRGITAPALVTIGAHDEIIAVDHVRRMATLIPGATLRIFEDTSHFAMWQDPTTVNAALVAFLAAPPSE